MEGYKIDHVKEVTTEVKKQADNLGLKQTIESSKKDETELYRTVLESMTPVQLSYLIKQQFINQDGTRKTLKEIKSHPSYQLMTQLSLDMLGYHTTNITGKYDLGTKLGIGSFEKQNNLKIDHIADVGFFKKCSEVLGSSLYAPQKEVVAPRDATTILRSSKIVLSNTIDTLQHDNISKWFDQILGNTPYASIKGQVMTFADDIVLNHGLEASEKNITRMFHLIFKENKTFIDNHRPYTPIGQVGKYAWIEAFKGLGFSKIPPYPTASKGNNRCHTNVINQLRATYGYMKLAGIFSATTPSELGHAYAKYNLGLSDVGHATKIKLFRGQAPEMKKVAVDKMKSEGRKLFNYSDVVHAEFAYYAPPIDRDDTSISNSVVNTVSPSGDQDVSTVM